MGDKASEKTCYTCGGSGLVHKGQPAAPQGKGGCFIATAAYDSAFAPEVVLLRQFRDDVLLTSALGRFLVQGYYAVSPHIAKPIARIPLLKTTVRKRLLDPIVRLLTSRIGRNAS